jgi:protein-disulfide isomerase
MIKRRIFTRLMMALTALSAPVFLAAAPASNWLLSFTNSAEGGYIIGNAAAPTKVVEYASYTCSYCARFESEDAPLLKRDFVAKGKVSLEIRSFVRDPIDLTIALLARCGGKSRFFGNHHHFMATQAQWMPKAESISAATEAKLKADDFTGFMTGTFKDMGLGTFARARGITDAQALICLKDPAALKAVLDMTDKAIAAQYVNGTPSFLINGKVRDDVRNIATLRPYLPK